MRVRAALAATAALLALAPALVHRRAPLVAVGARQALPYRARGAVHVHTSASRDAHGAAGSLDDVAGAARAAGLDFVVVTDHNTEASVGIDGYGRGVLLLGGVEKSTDAGHALVLGLRELPFRLDGDPATVVRDARDLGGFVVAAHPTGPSPESRWAAGLEGVAGIETMNLVGLTLPEAGIERLRLLGPLARATVDPLGALLAAVRFSRAPLTLWDRALAERPLAGLLGSDAHGGVPMGPVWVPVPSYRDVFAFASNHLVLAGPLTKDPSADRRLVLDALRSGHSYVAVDALADASGFLLEARSGEERGIMGDSVTLIGEAEVRAEADAPTGTSLVLLRDGEEVARGPRIDLRTDHPGAYRVEAYLDPALCPGSHHLPWILSNPVYLFPAGERAAREGRALALPPEEPDLPRDVEVVEAFGGPRVPEAWRGERSDGGIARLDLEDGALRLDYALGPGPRTHAAACDFEPRDLSPYRLLVLRVRADRRMRFDVQVRTADRAAPGGVRIWRRSVRAETGWRRAVVPLPTLKTYDHRGGRPDLAHVVGIHVHVDEAMLRPGSRGTLWIDDVGLAP